MKALEKNRDRRYESANALAADVKNFLTGEPVLAVAPTVAYRFKKFIHRYRVSLSIACLVVSALCGLSRAGA